MEGLGNPESFASCSHGAGRKMGRNEAIRTLSLEEEQRKLDKLGVAHAVRQQRDLDEAPSAYKNIVQVMADQEDPVKIVVKLWPLVVVMDNQKDRLLNLGRCPNPTSFFVLTQKRSKKSQTVPASLEN